MKLINIGFSNFVSKDRIVSIISPDSAPVKRLISEEREKGNLVDASYGRKTKSVIITDSKHVILSSLTPEILENRESEENEKR